MDSREDHNIIFLDIDGVVCTPRASVSVRDKGIMGYLDPVVLGLLSRLVEDCEAKIVISSTWRLGRDFKHFHTIFKVLGYPKIANSLVYDGGSSWRTESLDEGIRGDEIKAWIEDYGPISNYVILDDDSDILEEQKDNFVKCNTYDGMSYTNYRMCRHILEGGKVHDFRGD